jgi:archaellum component FlaD/FlaE
MSLFFIEKLNSMKIERKSLTKIKNENAAIVLTFL